MIPLSHYKAPNSDTNLDLFLQIALEKKNIFFVTHKIFLWCDVKAELNLE